MKKTKVPTHGLDHWHEAFVYQMKHPEPKPMAKVHLDKLKKLTNRTLKLLVDSLYPDAFEDSAAHFAYLTVEKAYKTASLEQKSVIVNQVADMASKAMSKWIKTHKKSLKI